jgi:hypothetical protein
MAIGQRFDAYSPHDKRNTRSVRQIDAPICTRHSPCRANETWETDSLYGNGELILVIADEPNTLLMTRAILEDRNYRVVCANTGVEALRH